jgi:hypothetical protein
MRRTVPAVPVSHRARLTVVGTYDERLWPPWWLWVVGWLWVLSLGLAVLVALGPVWALAVVLVGGGLFSWGLVTSAAPVRVVGSTLVAGPASIPVDLLGPAVAIDGEAARRVRGPDADPAAYHLIRGWVPGAVTLAVRDDADRTPYWYVATRRPHELAAAIEGARSRRQS